MRLSAGCEPPSELERDSVGRLFEFSPSPSTAVGRGGGGGGAGVSSSLSSSSEDSVRSIGSELCPRVAATGATGAAEASAGEGAGL